VKSLLREYSDGQISLSERPFSRSELTDEPVENDLPFCSDESFGE